MAVQRFMILVGVWCALFGCVREDPPDSPWFQPSGWAGDPIVVADSSFYALPGAVEAVDMDQDNDLDIAAVGPDRLLLFENAAGDGSTFRRHTLDDKGSANGLLVLDTNGDGFLDLVSAAGGPPDGRTLPGLLYEWRNPGAINEAWTCRILDPEPANFLHDILAADLDNDGGEEIVAPRGAAYTRDNHAFDFLLIYRRKDGGDWHRITMKGPDGIVRPQDFGLAAGDVNGDGFQDLIQFQTVWLNPSGKLEEPWSGFVFAKEFFPSNIVAEDMNKDGRLDLVFTEGHSHRVGSSRVCIWFNEGDAPGRVEVLGRAAQDPENLAVEDLDGNGVLDIVTGAMNWRNPPASPTDPSWNDRNGTLVVFAGERKGDGQRVWISCEVRSGIAALHHLSLADMDEDGRLDVLGANPGAAPPPAPNVPTVQIFFCR